MNGTDVPFLPPSASTVSGEYDLLLGYVTIVSVFFTVLIVGLLVAFAILYRRRDEAHGVPIHGSLPLELLWTGIPLVIVMTFFVWGADLFFRMKRPAVEPLEIYVVGKQWMWKVQHQEGPREINELHIPVNQPIKLTMTSEDVIHDFFIPAFRVKQDVLPGRYTTLSFEATRTGEYHLFCAEYCGTEHAGMGGTVYVMDPLEYQVWLSGGASGESLADAGERLFNQLGCQTCHAEGPNMRGPSLQGLYGSQVALADGGTVEADESYLRRSVMEPAADVVAGYDVIMPTYAGQISEEGLLQLIAYVRSLGGTSGGEQPSTPAAGAVENR